MAPTFRQDTRTPRTNAMRLYLETTVPNFLFASDSPDKQAETVAFWQWLKLGTEQEWAKRVET